MKPLLEPESGTSLARLKRSIGAHASMLVAYSGGVDSTLVLKVAHDVLAERSAGLIAGAVLICAIGVLYRRHEAARQHAEEQRKLLAVSTQSISRPEPIVIKISADLIHVSAISLGHPRLAIINGRSVAEGEFITIHSPTANVAVTLRVLKISDGRIDLSDGAQVIAARLEIPPNPRPKP